jgi:hypothetical protein
MGDDVICVLTYKSVDTVLRTGGTQSWTLDRARARSCKYVVLCRNARSNRVEGPEKHGTAFMVGKIKDVVPSTDSDGRWLILMSEYALCDWPDEWEGRNPVTYWKTVDFQYGQAGFDSLDFKPILKADSATSVGPISIDEAKRGLAQKYQVPPERIEIVIRG